MYIKLNCKLYIIQLIVVVIIFKRGCEAFIANMFINIGAF